MITISLDENGHFEPLAQGKKKIKEKRGGKQIEESTTSFIAGVLYDDKDVDGEYENEKKRIEAYLEGVCKDNKCKYPEDLHVSKVRKNSSNVKKVKETLSKTLSDFIQKGQVSKEFKNTHKNLGKYQPREGYYRLYALVALDPESIKSREMPGLLTEHRIASNLYVHMAETVVERLVFHNPLIKVTKVGLELATRWYEFQDDEEETREDEFIDQGYYSGSDKNGYTVSNNYLYRTILEREKEKPENSDVQVEKIMVESIRYEKKDNELFLDTNKFAFLYLADIVCANLWWDIKEKAKDATISLLEKKMDSLVGVDGHYLYFYDSIDLYYSKSWNALENGDYYSVLYHMYEGKTHTKGQERGFYERYWYPKLINGIVSGFDKSSYELSLKKLSDSTRQNNLNQDRLLYIYSCFQSIIEKTGTETSLSRELEYDYYDAGISIYNHLCDYEQASVCFKKCEELASYVYVEKYLRTLNKQIVMLCDRSTKKTFLEALKIGKTNLNRQKLLSALKKKIFVKEEKEDLDLAIAESQLAQVYAFLRDTKAEGLFKDALSLYESKESPNYLITCSYLLHYYIEMGMKKEYLELSKKYFGGNHGLLKQLDYLVKEGGKPAEEYPKFSMKFAMYVYLKGMYTFRKDDITPRLVEKLSDLDNTLKSINEASLNQLNGHPWEIAYKYLAFIMIDGGKEEAAREYRKRVRKSIGNADGLLKKIISKSIEEIDAKMSGTEPKSKRLTYMYN